MQWKICRWIGDTRATSAVEFAILAPVFILMLTGMMAYGIYFGAASSIQQIAADAARTAIAGLDETERNDLVEAFLDGNAEDYLFIERARLSFTIGDKPDDPSQYRVTVRYDASDLPIWNLSVPLPLPSPVIAYTSTIRRGGI
jgi:Flp pilus assembly protein TadG